MVTIKPKLKNSREVSRMSKIVKVKLPHRHSISYDIVIGIDLKDVAVDIKKLFPTSTCFIITDSNVSKLYGANFEKLLRRQGLESHTIYFPAGDRFKTRKTKEYLEDKLFKFGVRRNSVIIALGGGVVGDIAGFVAATINRGIPFVQIPTTLLSQVDSSVGGKVGINHPLGKNLIGTFYQPERVYIDPKVLNTLSDREYNSGLSEVVKYGAILDKNFFEFLEKNWLKITRRDLKTLIYIIALCCKLKAQVVEKDEFETDYRKILNFGHTIGHAVEKLSGFKVSHGHAISVGMVAESFIAYKLNMIDLFSITRLETLLEIFSLPTRIPPNFSLTDIVNATILDKKSSGELINYTLINQIGSGVINVALSENTIKHILKSI